MTVSTKISETSWHISGESDFKTSAMSIKDSHFVVLNHIILNLLIPPGSTKAISVTLQQGYLNHECELNNSVAWKCCCFGWFGVKAYHLCFALLHKYLTSVMILCCSYCGMCWDLCCIILPCSDITKTALKCTKWAHGKQPPLCACISISQITAQGADLFV